MSKVIFLKLVPQSFAKSDGPLSSELLDSIARGRSAIVIERTPDDLLAIQGYPLVPWKDKHKCWSLFRNAARNLLGIVQSSAISIRFADPPFTAVTSIAAILREPSHIVNLIVSSLETPVNTVPVEPAAKLWGLQARTKVDPYCKYREFYLDRAQSNSGCVRNKCNFEEMNKLISQLSEVSISLQRTQHECDEIAKRCSSSTRKPALKLEAIDGEELAEDSNVEKLVHIAESLTAHIIRQQSKQNQEGSPALPAAEPPILPMCPSDICVRPSFSGGVYVMWNPVRLDARDENRGHKVLGYMVYCDGALKVQVEGALTSQVEIHMLEGEKEYDIRVCTHTELCDSPLSAAVTYRHVHPKNYFLPPSNTSQLAKNRKSAKVESWLKTSRLDSGIDSTGTNDEDLRDYHHASHVHFAEDATHQHEGTELDDSKSTTSSHTSGIVTDMPPVSPKLRPTCSCNNCTTPLCGNSPSHTSHDLCYCSSPAFSTFSGDNAFDTVIDEPVETEPVKQVSLPIVMNVYTTPKRAVPPQNVTVQPTHNGYIRVSWTPVRRDFRGCCNGCFVLGYRIYVNGTSHLSVDGPTVYEALFQCPPQVPPPQHRMLIHVRTRSISSESGPSNTVIYNMLVHRTVATSGRMKLDSALSSTASLCRVESHQLPHRMPGGVARKHLARSVETYV